MASPSGCLYTLSLLHRVLERDRQRAALIQDGSDAAKMIRLQTQYDQLKYEYKLLDDYYQKEVQAARNRTEEIKGVLNDDFRHKAAEDALEMDMLRSQVATLTSQLDVATTQVAVLEGLAWRVSCADIRTGSSLLRRGRHGSRSTRRTSASGRCLPIRTLLRQTAMTMKN